MTWDKKIVLVTVKAYPEKSKKHGTVVCTAGVTNEGDWIRLYPMPYSSFLGDTKIQRYDWIEVECEQVKDEKLGRKESYRVRDTSVRIIDRSLSRGKVKGRAPWAERNIIVLPKCAPSLEYLEEEYQKDKTSLGLIKPETIIEFFTRESLQQPPEPKEYQRSLDDQIIPIIDIIPHVFAYKFRCYGCQSEKYHDIMCEDWELFESYRSWWKRYPRIDLLWEKLHEKFFNFMIQQDIHFYMGMHSIMPTWLIIGLYYPPKDLIVPMKKTIKTLDSWLPAQNDNSG
ncbi:MAG: hypothetical protein ABSD81_08845 [Methanomicrobiales archaeon]